MGDDLFTYEDGGVSMVVDGEREWLYSWVAGYHGDDTLVAYGTGDDALTGGGGSDTLISLGHSAQLIK